MRVRAAGLLASLAAAAVFLMAVVPAAAAAAVAVTMINFAYQPKDAIVTVGDTVTWTTSGPGVHTATSVDGRWDSGIVPSGGSFSRVFPTSGLFPYFCRVGDHRQLGMEGTIRVLDAPIAARAFVASSRLTGAEEVPPVGTPARGTAIYRLNHDGTALLYDLSVVSPETITLGHIHLGPKGVNGPVVVNLLSPACQRRTSSVRCVGTITASNFVGPLAGKSFGYLLGAINAGNTYTNVHSQPHPGGVARGQIETAVNVAG